MTDETARSAALPPAVIDLADAAEESVASEVTGFRNVDDEVKRGDLEIRRIFAHNVMILFALTNVFVMLGLGWLAAHETAAIAAKTMVSSDRIIDSKVVMTLLAATTVQLGTVIYTIARAIFPPTPNAGG